MYESNYMSTNSQNIIVFVKYLKLCFYRILLFKNFTELLCFLHDTPIKWYTICQSLYKAAIVLQ